MPDHRARRRGIEPQSPRARRGERQRDVHVAAAMWVVVDADAVEAGVLAPRDEVGHARQRGADGNAQVDLQRSTLGAPRAN